MQFFSESCHGCNICGQGLAVLTRSLCGKQGVQPSRVCKFLSISSCLQFVDYGGHGVSMATSNDSENGGSTIKCVQVLVDLELLNLLIMVAMVC